MRTWIAASVALACLWLFPQISRAERPSSATFRRPEVLKLMRNKESYHMNTTLMGQTKKGLIIAATDYAPRADKHYTKFRWVFLPYNKAKPVRIIKDDAARRLGLRPLRDARKEAYKLNADAKFGKGKPFKSLKLSYITTGTNKHAGTERSFVFSAKLTKPVDGARSVGLSVPMRKGPGAQTAFSW